MLTDNSKYKKQHNEVISYVREQIGIDLNQYRDGDGTNPSTTTYWDITGPMTCINWCGSTGGMDIATKNAILELVSKSNNKLKLVDAGAWMKYIFFFRASTMGIRKKENIYDSQYKKYGKWLHH